MLPEKALYHGRATSMSESFYKTYQLQVSLTAEPTQFCEVWKIRRRSYTTPWNAEHLKTSSNDLPTLEDLGRSKRFFSQGENECGRCGAVFGTNFCPNSPPCRRLIAATQKTRRLVNRGSQNDCDEYDHRGPSDMLTVLRILENPKAKLHNSFNAKLLQTM